MWGKLKKATTVEAVTQPGALQQGRFDTPHPRPVDPFYFQCIVCGTYLNMHFLKYITSTSSPPFAIFTKMKRRKIKQMIKCHKMAFK